MPQFGAPVLSQPQQEPIDPKLIYQWLLTNGALPQQHPATMKPGVATFKNPDGSPYQWLDYQGHSQPVSADPATHPDLNAGNDAISHALAEHFAPRGDLAQDSVIPNQPTNVVSAQPGQQPSPLGHEAGLADPLESIVHALAQAVSTGGQALTGVGQQIGSAISPSIGDAIVGPGAPAQAESRFNTDIVGANSATDRMAANNEGMRQWLSRPMGSGAVEPPEIDKLNLTPDTYVIVPDSTSGSTLAAKPSPPTIPTPIVQALSAQAQQTVPQPQPTFTQPNLEQPQPSLPSGPDIKSQLATNPGQLLAQLMTMKEAPTPSAGAEAALRHAPMPKVKPKTQAPAADPTDAPYVPRMPSEYKHAIPKKTSELTPEQMVNPTGEKRISIHRGTDGKIAGFSDGKRMVSFERDPASGRVMSLIERELQNAA